jgi:hypothetical protein
MSGTRANRDTVGIFSTNFTQILRNARLLDLRVFKPVILAQHPLERGATTTDHRILPPVKVTLSAIVQSADRKNTYRELNQLYLNGDTVSIQSNATVFTSMALSEMPHEESADMLNALTIGISFEQINFASSVFTIVPLNPQDSSIVPRGQIQSRPGPPANIVFGIAS